MHPTSISRLLRDARLRSPGSLSLASVGLSLSLASGACMPRDLPGDDSTTNLTEPDTTTTDDGPSTLGTTTSTVTSDSGSGGSVTDATTTDATDSSTTTSTTEDTDGTSSSTTTGDPPCDHDLTCDPDEDPLTCLADCAGCEVDEVCDTSTETLYACPADCEPTACDLDGEVDPLTEQCDDGNDVNTDACTDACKLNTCGDGYLYAKDQGGDEECDDGNLEDSDGCSSKCVREHRVVFVSSQDYKGNLTPAIEQLTGLALGDAHCQILASEADHPGNFRAWLSDGTKSPANRFGVPTGFSGTYELPNGTVIANGWDDLTDGTLLHAIDVDEKGKPVEASVIWTNTSVAGIGMGANHCKGWTSIEFSDKAPVGSSQASDGLWTEADDQFPCSAPARLYCIQVE
ncbi:MAG: DUF4215 domain-containing protein [Nannocystaceae bacterium]